MNVRYVCMYYLKQDIICMVDLDVRCISFGTPASVLDRNTSEGTVCHV